MKTSVEELEANGFSVNISNYMSQGWELVKSQLGIFIGFTLLFFIVSGVAGIIPFAGILVAPFFSGGMMVALRAADKGETVQLETFFSITKSSLYVQLLVMSIVSGIIIMIGILFCLIPGIYLGVAYTFAVPFLVFENKTDFWASMEASRRIISGNWFEIFGLTLAVGIIAALIGIFTCFIGLFVLTPWIQAVMYCAYKDIVGFSDDDESFKVTDHLIQENI